MRFRFGDNYMTEVEGEVGARRVEPGGVKIRPTIVFSWRHVHSPSRNT